MMERTLKQYVVDAFTDKVFAGNPAAVCVMDAWLPDEHLMKITRENNLSETAFAVKEGEKYHLRWFTPGAFVSPAQSFWRCAAYLAYPAIAIALPRIAMTVKMLKSSIAGELEKDYVRTAYSRGNSPCAALYRHVLRNAVVPTVAFLAMTVADIVAGSVIIEQVFAISGLGRLLLSSISNRDFPVVQAIVVILALWVVLVNCLADIINQQLDPRLRLQ